MRQSWKRTVAGLLLFGAAGGAAFGLTQLPTDVPPVIPPADTPPAALPLLPPPANPTPLPAPVVQAQAVEPTAKQESGVSLEWSGPPVVKVNVPTEYTLTVRNVSGQLLQKVTVQVKVPKDAAVKETAPVARVQDGIYLWELGDLDVKGAKAIKVTLSSPHRGELGCQAWVTFTGTAAMKAMVKEPKLAVTVKAPERVCLGDEIPVEYTVTNVGDYPAGPTRVLLNASLAEANLAAMAPGESKTYTAKVPASQGGAVLFEAVAVAPDRLTASAKATVEVMVPRLELGMTGPAERIIGRKAAYTITTRNGGNVPLTGVVVREHVPASFRVLAVGAGGVLAPAGDVLSWAVGDLAPGQAASVTFEGVSDVPGQFNHHADATGSRQSKATADCRTAVEGIAALRMEAIDSIDPIEKGQETTYEVRIVNTGSKADADLRLVCQVPPQMKFKSANGPVSHTVGEKGEVTFDLIRELAPKTEAVVKVTVVGVVPGDARFKATLTSKHLSTPVVKEESTRIYGE